MNKKEKLRAKALRQQEIVNGAKTASRSLTAEEQAEFDNLQREIDTLKTEIAEEERASQAQNEREAAIIAERSRVSDINAICRDFEMDPAEHIRSGASVDQVRTAALEKVKNERQAPPAAGVKITKEASDKFREAVSDAILMRAGVGLEKPADGATELRRMSLRDIAVDCLIQAGRTNANRMDDDTLFREAFAGMTGQSAFAAVMDNTVNKSMQTAYRAQNTTYQLWTGRGSNPDFKATAAYQISEAGDLVEMTESGEFKHDEMKDSKVTKQLLTFGRSFSISRKALINDDINIITKLPQAYVRAAGRGINRAVYKIIGENPAIYDGTTLFHADHGNLGTGAAIGVASVGEARKLMRVQKNLRANEFLNIGPRFMLVPAAIETDAEKFLNSVADPAASHAGVTNPFRGKLELVTDAELDGYDANAWFLAADPADIDTIEVTYLNGQDMPMLESAVLFDQLGMKWRIYIDYGITAVDYRGLVKNAGPS